MPATPRIAVQPPQIRPWLQQAVRQGGGEVVHPSEAEALVWTDAYDVEGLQTVLDKGPHIRWIQLPWAGVEPFALGGLFTQSYQWTSGKGVYAKPVAEHALALALAGLRDLKLRSLAQTWGSQSGTSLIGGRVTIFGAGGITQELIRLLQPFDCQITVVRRHPHPMVGVNQVVGFDQRLQVLPASDVVFLALALTPETQALISRHELALMGSQAWLVNVARGAHIVTEDLVVALQHQIIRGAAMDVTDPEPLPAGHPLWSLPNCIITPHTANTEEMAIPLISERVRENVQRFRLGQPLIGIVDPVLGY